jgi:nitrogen regulatory protein PII
MAKIEVVIDGDQVPAVRDLFIEAGATGYTGVSGVGRR